MKAKHIFRRSIALTNEHGSWVFLLSPLLIGLFLANRWSLDVFMLTTAALAAFLVRHPITFIVKVHSGRRPRRDLPAAWFWTLVYGIVGIASMAILLTNGHQYLLFLALPGIPVFLWHLYLVSKRSERRKMGIEIIASGVLALSSPAIFWVGIGHPDPIGWLLWGLTWAQSAASIVYAYLRLEQRVWKELPDFRNRFQQGQHAIAFTTFNTSSVVLLALWGILSPWLVLAYVVQWAESLWGTMNPALGVKPSKIGIRQFIVSVLFTIFFIIFW